MRSKKLIVAAILAAVVLVGSIGGVVLAQENENTDGDSNQPGAIFSTVWDKVAIILQDDGVDITTEQLKAAFTEAKGELRTEAMQNRLQSLVDEGKITQEQADEYLSWQAAKPDIPVKFGFRGIHKMHGFGGPCVPVE